MDEPTARIGIIGGSGLYHMDDMKVIDRVNPNTPFGKPSDHITLGEISDTRVAFLPRHAQGHRILPTEVPVRANIYALKALGVEWIISVSAVGSLQENVHPLDLVVPDQLIDRTSKRPSTFFGEGIVGHVGFGNPFCGVLNQKLVAAAHQTQATVHQGGTCIVMEGPAFSTKAESQLYRTWGATIIGMTALPEAKLAREAEICYSMLACATDYDVWHESEEDVTVDMIIANVQKNVFISQQVLRNLVPKLLFQRECECSHALSSSIVTDPEFISDETRQRLDAIIGKQFN